MESEVRNRKAKPSPQTDKNISSRKSTKKSGINQNDDHQNAAECKEEEQQQQRTSSPPVVCQNERVQRTSDEPSTSMVDTSTKSECKNADVVNDSEIHTESFPIQVHLDLMTIALFVVAICTRIYKLSEPNNIVWV